MTKSEFQFVVNHVVEEMVAYLMEDYQLAITDAFDRVYNSRTYQNLLNKKTGLYRYAAAYTYEYLKKEI